MAVTVSAVAERVGLSAHTIRYYERVGLRLREIGELLRVFDQGQCPCGHTETLLHEQLPEVRAELERLRVLEAELIRLLGRYPDPACPDTVNAAAFWWCADGCTDECEPSERGR